VANSGRRLERIRIPRGWAFSERWGENFIYCSAHKRTKIVASRNDFWAQDVPKMLLRSGSATNHAGELTALPQVPWVWEGAVCSGEARGTGKKGKSREGTGERKESRGTEGRGVERKGDEREAGWRSGLREIHAPER